MLEPLLRIVFDGKLDDFELDARGREVFALALVEPFLGSMPTGRLARYAWRIPFLFLSSCLMCVGI